MEPISNAFIGRARAMIRFRHFDVEGLAPNATQFVVCLHVMVGGPNVSASLKTQTKRVQCYVAERSLKARRRAIERYVAQRGGKIIGPEFVGIWRRPAWEW